MSLSGCVLAAKTAGTSASTSIAPESEIVESILEALSVNEIVFNFSIFCIMSVSYTHLRAHET